MNIVRGIWIGIVFYAINLLFTYFVAWATKINDINSSFLLWAGLAGLVVFAEFFSLWYFKGRSTQRTWQEGLYFGAIFIVISIIFDVFVLGIGSLLDPGIFLKIVNTYLTWQYGLSALLVLVTCTLIGKIKPKRIVY